METPEERTNKTQHPQHQQIQSLHPPQENCKKKKKQKKERNKSFDMSKYHMRKIALRFYYLGWSDLLTLLIFCFVFLKIALRLCFCFCLCRLCVLYAVSIFIYIFSIIVGVCLQGVQWIRFTRRFNECCRGPSLQCTEEDVPYRGQGLCTVFALREDRYRRLCVWSSCLSCGPFCVEKSQRINLPPRPSKSERGNSNDDNDANNNRTRIRIGRI